MRVRHLIEVKKSLQSDTRWRTGDLQPRHCPIYPKSKPNGPAWQWRSAKAICGDLEFWLVATVNVSRGNWKSLLITKGENGHSVVGRFEYHSSHPGTHLHAHCDRGGVETGPTSMNDLTRIPPASRRHRRASAYTLSTFWESSRRFFRIEHDAGPLFQ